MKGEFLQNVLVGIPLFVEISKIYFKIHLKCGAQIHHESRDFSFALTKYKIYILVFPRPSMLNSTLIWQTDPFPLAKKH